MPESWTVNVPFSSSERIRDIVSREQTLDNINSKVATEATVDTLLTENTFLNSVDANDEILVKIATDTTGLFKTGDFTETRTISQDNVGLFKTDDFTETRVITDVQTGGTQTDELAIGINSDSAGLATEATLDNVLTESTFSNTDFFGTADFTETRTIEQNNAGLFEASDFTEARNVRELQNETSTATGQNTGGGTLTAQAIPDGSTVRVQALQSNDKPVLIDGNFELVSGQGVDLGVDDVSKISYQVQDADSSDGVCWIVEA